jgi:hypothetical protein
MDTLLLCMFDNHKTTNVVIYLHNTGPRDACTGTDTDIKSLEEWIELDRQDHTQVHK